MTLYPHTQIISRDTQTRYPLSDLRYSCPETGGLLEVVHDDPIAGRDAAGWRELFESRGGGAPGPDGSGVWRYREWVLPDLPEDHIVTLGEGATPLVAAKRLSSSWDIELLLKQCGQSLSGSFKDLGMTVLVSHVNNLRQSGIDVPVVACASSGDTSAALAAYGAAAGIPCVVLLPQGKVSQAQLVQPLSNGARVVAVDTDFDGCMAHMIRLAEEEGVYLANSRNPLRIEGQKTVAFEIAQGLGWNVPDWVAIPSGNLGNVSALVKGFVLLRDAGITDRLPRVLVAQAESADPLFRAYQKDFAELVPVEAQATQASAIRIGNPVSYPRAVEAIRASNGVVERVSEQDLAAVGREADEAGLYVCPHTCVGLAAIKAQQAAGVIKRGERVVCVATAHGLKFTEFKLNSVRDQVPGARLGSEMQPVEVANDWSAVKDAVICEK